MTRVRFILRSWRRLATLSAVIAGVAATGVAAAPVPAQAQPDPLYRFEHQAIAWHDCRTNPNDPIAAQLAAVGALCGELTVPLDYRHPDGRTISIAVDRRPATDTAHKLGTLVINTGGPDASRSAVAAAPSAAPALGAQYDLVSFDPRFFGLSTPLNCGWPTNLEARSQIATPDRPAFDANVAAARQLASLCAPYADELPFASTRDIARDMDILRAALGEPRVSYLAWSYGGYLVPYAGQLVMHQALHGSRMVTLNGVFGHAQYLHAGNACVDTTVQNYLLGGRLPSHDLTCQAG